MNQSVLRLIFCVFFVLLTGCNSVLDEFEQNKATHFEEPIASLNIGAINISHSTLSEIFLQQLRNQLDQGTINKTILFVPVTIQYANEIKSFELHKTENEFRLEVEMNGTADIKSSAGSGFVPYSIQVVTTVMPKYEGGKFVAKLTLKELNVSQVRLGPLNLTPFIKAILIEKLKENETLHLFTPHSSLNIQQANFKILQNQLDIALVSALHCAEKNLEFPASDLKDGFQIFIYNPAMKCIFNDYEYQSNSKQKIILQGITFDNNGKFESVFDVWNLKFPKRHNQGSAKGSMEFEEQNIELNLDEVIVQDRHFLSKFLKPMAEKKLTDFDQILNHTISSFNSLHPHIAFMELQFVDEGSFIVINGALRTE